MFLEILEIRFISNSNHRKGMFESDAYNVLKEFETLFAKLTESMW